MNRPGLDRYEQLAETALAELIDRPTHQPTDAQMAVIRRAWSAGLDAEDAAILAALDLKGGMHVSQ